MDSAVEAQLVDRYLRENLCQHGIYLVGWYNCDKWDQEDYRQRISKNAETDEVKRSLQAQANNLSKADLAVRVVTLNVSLR